MSNKVILRGPPVSLANLAFGKRCISRVLFLCIFIFVAAAISGCNDDVNNKQEQAEAMPVKVFKIKEQEFPVMGQYVAQIEALKTVDIRARVQGHLKERHFEEGQVVSEGQLLFVLMIAPMKRL